LLYTVLCQWNSSHPAKRYLCYRL